MSPPTSAHPTTAAPVRSGPILYISLLVEALRARPKLMFWTAALAQAWVWTLVPALFFAAPPGDVPLVLAVGREWPLGSQLGPPLANWLGELAFDLFGHRVLGVYLLSQVCIVVTFWAVFELGRATVGTRHAVMAVLLMVGISAFSLPTPEFGPTVLAMPLVALALMHAWRAVGNGQRRHWLALGVVLGLLVLTTYAGFIFIALIVGFIAATERGRAAVDAPEAWAGGMIVVLIAFPHLIWLEASGTGGLPNLAPLLHAFAPAHLGGLVRMLGLLVAAHALMLVLVVVAGGVKVSDRVPAPVFERPPIDPLAKTYIYLFALVPALIAAILAVVWEQAAPVGGIGPVVVLSGLAVVVAAGDVIRLHRVRIVGVVWLALLLAPAAIVVAGNALAPFVLALDVGINQPAGAMAQFFTDSFERRTGKPLDIVVGDARLAGMIALASRDRPHLVVDQNPALTPWLSDADIRRRGAVVLWRATESAEVPDTIRARFADLVAEVPRSFERPVQGRLPLLRIGWGVIRPEAAR